VNIIQEIDDITNRFFDEIGGDVEIEVNIYSDKENIHDIKEKLIEDSRDHYYDKVIEYYDTDFYINFKVDKISIVVWL